MLQRLISKLPKYPRQFWFLIFGMLVSTTGMGMIWPFLTIYLRQRLGLSLTTVSSLLLLDAIVSVVTTFIAGPIADRFGRKWIMVLSLTMVGLIYIVMSFAGTLPVFAVLMGLRGAFMPLYRIGADAMVADMIPEDQRAEAYSISRTVNNVGVALGPAAGGFVTAASFTAAFFGASVSLFVFSIFIAIFMAETMPAVRHGTVRSALPVGGYGRIFRDRFFLTFVLGFTLTGMGSSVVFSLLTAYMKDNFHIAESLSGFVMTVNALMVVFFQYAVTRVTRRRKPLPVMVTGALLYALGIGSMALGRSFPHFAISMAVMTLGELTLVPTSTTFAANLAPAEMRARYMSVYNLGWGISHGFGPLAGGVLNDNLAPVAIWLGGMTWALLSALTFIGLTLRGRPLEKEPQVQPLVEPE